MDRYFLLGTLGMALLLLYSFLSFGKTQREEKHILISPPSASASPPSSSSSFSSFSPPPKVPTTEIPVEEEMDPEVKELFLPLLKKISAGWEKKEEEELLALLKEGAEEEDPTSFRIALEELIREYPPILSLLVKLFGRLENRDTLFQLAQILQMADGELMLPYLDSKSPLHREMAIYALLFYPGASSKILQIYRTVTEEEPVLLAASFYLEKNFSHLPPKEQKKLKKEALERAFSSPSVRLCKNSLLIAAQAGFTKEEVQKVRSLLYQPNPDLALAAIEALVQSKALSPLDMAQELQMLLSKLPPDDPRRKVLKSWLKQ